MQKPTIHLPAIARATSATIVLVTVLGIWTQKSPRVHDALANAGHSAWVAEGVMAGIAFAFLYLLFSVVFKRKFYSDREVTLLIATTVVCGLTVFLFFFWSYFG